MGIGWCQSSMYVVRAICTQYIYSHILLLQHVCRHTHSHTTHTQTSFKEGERDVTASFFFFFFHAYCISWFITLLGSTFHKLCCEHTTTSVCMPTSTLRLLLSRYISFRSRAFVYVHNSLSFFKTVALVHDFVDGGFLVTRTGDDVFVVRGNVHT